MKQLLLILITAALASGCASLPAPDFEPTQTSFTVLTYNVNWGGGGAEAVSDFLWQSDADLICLQETHRQWESHLRRRLSKTYPYSVFHNSGGAGGIAFMSRVPLRHTRALRPKAGWYPGLLTVAESPLGPIQVLNVHLQPPLNRDGTASLSAYTDSPAVHRKELEGFFKVIKPELPVLVTGDFNEHERREGVSWLIDNGFTDALSLYDRRSDTWEWRLKSGLKIRNRYDHIVFSDHFHCTGARVDRVNASDHHPVTAVLVKAPVADGTD
jgi:endonuclease/exonuclease/phosphatase family metal-dependent hydrolase